MTCHMASAVAAFLTLAATAFGGQPKSRTFEFTYESCVTGLKPGQEARIWLPAPRSSDDQQVSNVRFNKAPTEMRVTSGLEYHNQIIYFESEANAEGKIPLSVTYRIKRNEVSEGTEAKHGAPELLARFLRADSMVPVGGKSLSLIKDSKLPGDQMALGRMLYDTVNDHMRYGKDGTGWGRGDSDWACENRFGNCSDFHSLFISLARACKIPAKFEIGFSLPEKRGQGEISGYHCWAKFKPEGRGWIPVDISEANKNPALRDYYFGHLSVDRVKFSVGRDIELAPKQDGPRLNFFIYPYVEVDGNPYPTEKIEKRFSFRDLPEA